MPSVSLDGLPVTIDDIFYILADLKHGTILTASATSVVYELGAPSIYAGTTITLTGTGFATTVIGGKTYLNAGTISGIDAAGLFAITNVGLAASTLHRALRRDELGTNLGALEALFLSRTYNFTALVDPAVQSGFTSSSDGIALTPTGPNVYLLANAANNITAGSGSDSIRGGSAADYFAAGGGNDRLRGEGGNDFLLGEAGNDTLSGGSGDDTAEGGAGSDQISGGSGNDSLNGGGGDDSLAGENGNDSLVGETGNDSLVGGAGNDSLYGVQGNDTLEGGGGNDIVEGGDGNDVIFGGDGSDTLYGDAGNDSVAGGAGNDDVGGGSGSDTLSGGTGADSLSGGTGSDKLDGGAGADTLSGGPGADTFQFTALAHIGRGATRDVIEDFLPGTDLIDLSAIGGLGFIGTAPFTGPMQVRFDPMTSMLQIDADGNGTVDHEIFLDGVAALQPGDVIV